MSDAAVDTKLTLRSIVDSAKAPPANSVKAGGLVGVLALVCAVAANAYGLPITYGEITSILLTVTAVLSAVHVIPDSFKNNAVALNTTVEKLAAAMPMLQDSNSPQDALSLGEKGGKPRISPLASPNVNDGV